MMALLAVMLLITLQGNQPAAEFLDFTFYDAADREYHSTRVLEDMLINQSGRTDPRVILIETSSLDHPAYRKQINILQSRSLQEYDFLCVVACPAADVSVGYHTDCATASSLVEDEGSFRVVLLNSSGAVIETWNGLATARHLRRHIPRKQPGLLVAERDAMP